MRKLTVHANQSKLKVFPTHKSCLQNLQTALEPQGLSKGRIQAAKKVDQDQPPTDLDLGPASSIALGNAKLPHKAL